MIINFNSGPSHLPFEVLQECQKAIIDFKNSGLSILEIGHRTKEYDDIVAEAESCFKKLMNIGDEYHILFLQGGATQQFSQIPYNFLSDKETALYITTGTWSEKAHSFARLLADVVEERVLDNNEFSTPTVPLNFQTKDRSKIKFLHLTTNETITGTQWKTFECLDQTIPWVADMSSDIFSRKIDFKKFSLIYFGAQKNLGIAGLTIVLIRKEFLLLTQKEKIMNPLSYNYFVNNKGIPNTPPVFAVYTMLLMLRWINQNGGLDFFESNNNKKANMIYDLINRSEKVFSKVPQYCRSIMNIPFFFWDRKLENIFLDEAEKAGFYGIRGHRTSGGVRISNYNAISNDSVNAFLKFAQPFIK